MLVRGHRVGRSRRSARSASAMAARRTIPGWAGDGFNDGRAVAWGGSGGARRVEANRSKRGYRLASEVEIGPQVEADMSQLFALAKGTFASMPAICFPIAFVYSSEAPEGA